jgi:hypothetical protein
VTRTTPLVWVGVADNPVALGLVGSFAHPGGKAVEGCCSATLCRRHFASVLQLRLAKRIEQAVVED